MRRIIAAIFCAALIGGCSSDKEIAAAAPDKVIMSPKSPGEFANCLARTKVYYWATEMRDDGAIVVKQKSEKGTTGATFTITAADGGSRVELRHSAFAFDLFGPPDCY